MASNQSASLAIAVAFVQSITGMIVCPLSGKSAPGKQASPAVSLLLLFMLIYSLSSSPSPTTITCVYCDLAHSIPRFALAINTDPALTSPRRASGLVPVPN